MFRIKVEPVPERGTYKVVESIIIEGVFIPKDWEFNGASIPAVLWPIIGSPFDPRFMAPAALHDRIYETGELPKEEGDLLFRKTLLHNNVSKEKAKIMYKGVHYFGGPFYNYENEVA